MNERFYLLCRAVVYLFFRLLFRLRVEGRGNVPPQGGVVVCANHRSYLDPPVLAVAFPRPIYYMAKEELFSVPLLAPLIRVFGAFPVKRGVSDLRSLRRGLELLRQGKAVGIFPEGTRRRLLGRGHPGAIFLALQAGVPVIPVAISGSYLPFSRVTVRIGKPLVLPRPQGRGRRRLEEATEDLVMGGIRALLEKG